MYRDDLEAAHTQIDILKTKLERATKPPPKTQEKPFSLLTFLTSKKLFALVFFLGLITSGLLIWLAYTYWYVMLWLPITCNGIGFVAGLLTIINDEKIVTAVHNIRGIVLFTVAGPLIVFLFLLMLLILGPYKLFFGD